MYKAEFLEHITDEWRAVRAVRIGFDAPSTPFREPELMPSSTDEAVLCIWEGSTPILRVDIFANSEGGCFREARVVDKIVAVGFGEHLYLIEPSHGLIRTIRMPGYFSHLYLPDDLRWGVQAFGFLATSATSAMRIGPNGTILWHAENLAVDGVLLSDIRDGVIHGSGEWDPPGGWQDLALDLETGAILLDPEIAANKRFANLQFVEVAGENAFKAEKE